LPRKPADAAFQPTVAVLLGFRSQAFFIKIFVEKLWKKRINIIVTAFISKQYLVCLFFNQSGGTLFAVSGGGII
jgi:hypothetical protein